MPNYLSIKSSSKIELGLKESPLKKINNFENLFVKVDAENSEINNFGGSKLRKAEYLLGSLQKDYKIDEITSFGAFGSFHLKNMAFWCKEIGIKFHAKTWNQPWHIEEARNFIYTKKHSTSIRWMPSFLSLLYQGKIWKKSESHAIVPIGGDKISGALSFYYALLELNDQIDLTNSKIYIAAGTCSAVSGLLLGASKLNKNTQIIASNIVSKYIPVVSRILKIAKESNLVYDLDIKLNSELIRCEFSGDSNKIIDYGTVQSDYNSLNKIAKSNGFKIDPTYTGKTFKLALEEYRNNSTQDGPYIFWNTRS